MTSVMYKIILYDFTILGIVLSKDPVLRYQDGTKKNEDVTVPGFCKFGGTEYLKAAQMRWDVATSKWVNASN